MTKRQRRATQRRQAQRAYRWLRARVAQVNRPLQTFGRGKAWSGWKKIAAALRDVDSALEAAELHPMLRPVSPLSPSVPSWDPRPGVMEAQRRKARHQGWRRDTMGQPSPLEPGDTP